MRFTSDWANILTGERGMQYATQGPRASATGERTRIALVGEYVAGHVTFLDTLARVAEQRDDLDADVIRLAFDGGEGQRRVPLLSENWSVRASLLARDSLRALDPRPDAVLIHTQTAALASLGIMRGVPVAISTDATPTGYDEVGGPHGHQRGSVVAEAAKRAVVGRAYRASAMVIAWSEWARASLMSDYHVASDRITVLPAGVSLPRLVDRDGRRGPVRLLYVARNFRAKGGEDLLAALAPMHDWHLDAVTLSEVSSTAQMTVHRGLTPASPELAALYASADVCVLPTHSDASPFAVLEGMAAGLPVVSTSIGAIAEMIGDGGVIVSPGDVPALRDALARLLGDRERRLQVGAAARARAASHYDATRQGNRLLDLLVSLGVRHAAPALGSSRR